MKGELNNQREMKSDSLAVLDARLMDGSGTERRRFDEKLLEICRDFGVFYLDDPLIRSTLCTDVLDAAREFFKLPTEAKEAVGIGGSKHFRGYSELKNERDWREQFHLGVEMSAYDSASDKNDYWKLQGPNLFPARLGIRWQKLMLRFMDEIESLASRLLAAVARIINLPKNYFFRQAQDNAYLLMKLINYYPQHSRRSYQSGVAAHCDWSWLTFLLQNKAGLQVQIRSGQWINVPPVPQTVVVNLGELLEILTAGYFYAAPHRVVNNSSKSPRTSVPIFINPALSSVIEPMQLSKNSEIEQKIELTETKVNKETAHVHRVARPHQRVEPFIFGESEWRRKGLGRWCYQKECCE